MKNGANMRRAGPKILIFRLGSIGDFVISLPCLHLVRKTYPEAEIGLLTNRPADARSLPASDILTGTGLVDVYFNYPGGTRAPLDLWRVRRVIRRFKPDCLIHLAPRHEPFAVARDYAFFRLCGVGNIVAQLAPDLRRLRPPPRGEMQWEREAHRLARVLAHIGTVDIERLENWNLRLTESEIGQADACLSALSERDCRGSGFIAISVGTKQAIKDWGPDNWRTVMKALVRADLGLVAVGAGQDVTVSQALLDLWPGPTLNLCGTIPPRVSAAVLRRAAVFLCHDSGPMHLASTVGTPCVAVFSRHNRPGEWYPIGSQHRILYPAWRHGTIQAIRPRQVVAAAREVLAAAGLGAGEPPLARVA